MRYSNVRYLHMKKDNNIWTHINIQTKRSKFIILDPQLFYNRKWFHAVITVPHVFYSDSSVLCSSQTDKSLHNPIDLQGRCVVNTTLCCCCHVMQWDTEVSPKVAIGLCSTVLFRPTRPRSRSSQVTSQPHFFLSMVLRRNPIPRCCCCFGASGVKMTKQWRCSDERRWCWKIVFAGVFSSLPVSRRRSTANVCLTAGCASLQLLSDWNVSWVILSNKSLWCERTFGGKKSELNLF